MEGRLGEEKLQPQSNPKVCPIAWVFISLPEGADQTPTMESSVLHHRQLISLGGELSQLTVGALSRPHLLRP